MISPLAAERVFCGNLCVPAPPIRSTLIIISLNMIHYITLKRSTWFLSSILLSYQTTRPCPFNYGFGLTFKRWIYIWHILSCHVMSSSWHNIWCTEDKCSLWLEIQQSHWQGQGLKTTQTEPLSPVHQNPEGPAAKSLDRPSKLVNPLCWHRLLSSFISILCPPSLSLNCLKVIVMNCGAVFLSSLSLTFLSAFPDP